MLCLMSQWAVKVLESHPNIPKAMMIDPSKKSMALKRQEIACTLFNSSSGYIIIKGTFA